jgi:hypothetical protein
MVARQRNASRNDTWPLRVKRWRGFPDHGPMYGNWMADMAAPSKEIHVDVFQSVNMAALGASSGQFDSRDPQLSLKSIPTVFI